MICKITFKGDDKSSGPPACDVSVFKASSRHGETLTAFKDVQVHRRLFSFQGRIPAVLDGSGCDSDGGSGCQRGLFAQEYGDQ